MSLSFFIAIGTTIFFGLLAIYFSTREEKLKKELHEHEAIQKRRLYEISTLRALQERIGYSLDIERIIDTITGSLKNLFPYSTVSSLLIEPQKLVFKTTLEEQVSRNFVDEVKRSMVASLGAILDKSLPTQVEEVRIGMLPDNTNGKMLASFFHIPLVVQGKVVGLINISSTQPGLYKEADMTILYQMTSIASSALSRLREVIDSEENKLLAMIASLSDGLLFLDANMQLTVINMAAKKFLEVENLTTIAFADLLPILGSACDILSLIKKAQTEKKTITLEKVPFTDKKLRILVTPVLQIREGEEKIIGTTIILHDVTLEESLNALKEDFTNGIVHELRAPLTAIKAGAELLLTDTSLGASSEKVLKIIDEQTKRMLSDITSLLDAAKIEAGKFVVSKKADDIEKIVQDVLLLFLPQAEEKHIMLTTAVAKNLPQVLVDRARISEVLQSIVANSLKFTQPGGMIEISASETFAQHLPKSATNPGILISVKDTGIGIPKDKQQYLFSKFAQIGTSSIPAAKNGTGLGLYIAKGIVEAHGGQIYLTSTEGKGTTVSFVLPLAAKEQVIRTAAAAL